MICVNRDDKTCENISFVYLHLHSGSLRSHAAVVFGYLTRYKSTYFVMIKYCDIYFFNIVIKFRIPPPGMETHIPVLFLDLNGKWTPDFLWLITLNGV